MESFVMPAWMAGIQMRRMGPETSMSAWIPALHAGTTESRSRPKTDPGLHLRIFKGGHEVREARKLNKGRRKFSTRNIRTLRDLRDLRGDKVIRRSFVVAL
jgi:hypothetical protein